MASRHQAARIIDALAWCFSLNSDLRPDSLFEALVANQFKKSSNKKHFSGNNR
jgi:hypothetical protein